MEQKKRKRGRPYSGGRKRRPTRYMEIIGLLQQGWQMYGDNHLDRETHRLVPFKCWIQPPDGLDTPKMDVHGAVAMRLFNNGVIVRQERLTWEVWWVLAPGQEEKQQE